MNLKAIKAITTSGLSDEYQSRAILEVLANDPDVIPNILSILEIERETKRELILDSNAELSRALIVLKDDNLKWNKSIASDPKWVSDEIIKHYKKWKNVIKCNFKIKELE